MTVASLSSSEVYFRFGNAPLRVLLVSLVLVTCCTAGVAVASEGVGNDSLSASESTVFLKQYCADCHGNGAEEGERSFDHFSLPIQSVEDLVTADEIADGIAERLAAEIEARVRFRVAIAQRVDALEKREAALDEGIDGFYTITLRVHELSAELDQLEAVATALAKEGQKINAKNSMIKRFFARVKKAVSPKKGLDLLTVSGCLGDIERRVESLSLDLVSTGSLFSSRI